jgi:GNAT superfamily N-acetyltransferase
MARDGGADAPLLIRPMTEADLDTAIDWAAAEGWNPGLADAECFRAADPDGFLMLVENGEPAASISVVRYPGRFGFLGFYIARPDRRGRGLGFRLWQAGMARLNGCTVGLDGIVAQQANYARSGFVLAHRNVRYEGAPAFGAAPDPRVVPVTVDLLPAVLAFDRAFFPADRSRFLRCWLRPDRRRALAFIEDGSVKGFGVIRACRAGHKVGPLFGRDAGIAAALFAALASGAEPPIILDVPEPNRDAVALARELGFAPSFETARMYRGPAPDLPLAQIFGISTFELG